MTRRTWLALGALLVFAGLLVYTLYGGRTDEASEALTPDAFWQEDRESARRVEVERADGTRLVLERAEPEPSPVAYQVPERFRGAVSAPFEAFVPPGPETRWWLVEPEHAPADSGTVTSLLFTLSEPRPQSEVSSSPSEAELAGYGLEPPQATVRLHLERDGESVVRELQVGDATPLRTSTGGVRSYYVTVPGREGVYTLSSYPIENIFEGAEAFRLMQFARFGPDNARALRLLWDGKAPVELTLEGETWRLTGPVAAPADRSAVRDLLYDLELIRAEEIVNEQATDEELARYGLDNPRGEAIIFLKEEPATTSGAPVAAGDDAQTGEALPRAQVLWIGNFLSDGSGIYVRLAGERTVYRIKGDRIQSFFDATAQPLRLAPKGLLPQGWQSDAPGSVIRVSWTSGGETRVLERPEAGWPSGEAGAALLQRVREFTADEVLAAGAEAEAQARYSPGDDLPAGAEQLVLDPAPGTVPATPVVVTRLPGEETYRGETKIRLLWAAGDDRLLLRADPADWENLMEGE
ncbi:MAG TPA: DUF4340 domain-containing protein [Limnochorda sp.]